jgi:hypothetical protein
VPQGFANPDLREHFAPLLGEAPTTTTQGPMTYPLRRLPLHGLIVRQPATHRYALTDQGRRIALFFTRSYARLLRPGLAEVESPELPQDTALRCAFAQLERTMDQHAAQAKLI